jgi:hypothetical protein
MLTEYAARSRQISWFDRRSNPRPRRGLSKDRHRQPPGADENARYELFREGARSVRREFGRALDVGRVNTAKANLIGLKCVPELSEWRRLCKEVRGR